MNIECPFCNSMKTYDGDDDNFASFYGTKCLSCGKFIPPISKPKFIQDQELKLKILKGKVRKAIRKRLTNSVVEKKDGD